MGFKEVFAVVFESEGLEELINDLNTARDAVRETQREIDNLGKNRSAEKPTRVVPIHPAAPQKQQKETVESSDTSSNNSQDRTTTNKYLKNQKKRDNVQKSFAFAVTKGFFVANAALKLIAFAVEKLPEQMKDGMSKVISGDLLNMSPKLLATLENMGKMNQINSQIMNDFLMHQQKLIGDAKNGNPEGLIKQIESTGVKITDNKGQLLTPDKIMRSFAEWAEKQDDKAKILSAGSALHMDPKMIRFLSKGVKNFDEEFEKAEKITFWDDEKAEKAAKAQKQMDEAWLQFQQSLMHVLNDLMPFIATITATALKIAAKLLEPSTWEKLKEQIANGLLPASYKNFVEEADKPIPQEMVKNTPKGAIVYGKDVFYRSSYNNVTTTSEQIRDLNHIMGTAQGIYRDASTSMFNMPMGFMPHNIPQPTVNNITVGDVIVRTNSDNPQKIGEEIANEVKSQFNNLLPKYPNTIKQ